MDIDLNVLFGKDSFFVDENALRSGKEDARLILFFFCILGAAVFFFVVSLV